MRAMVETLLAVVVLLLFVVLALVVVSLVRGGRVDLTPLDARLQSLQVEHERIERAVRDELVQSRAESSAQARELRGEVGDRLEGFAGELRQFRESSEESARGLRREVLGLAQTVNETLVRQIEQFSMVQGEQLKAFAQQLTALGEATERRMETLRATVEERLGSLQEDNGARLERIRQTVDERLQGTLEARLGESFRAVSERLEQVHRGLGEMQALASGVGDLKRVLTNVKTRGTWGEVQLGALLEQVLAPGQYAGERGHPGGQRGPRRVRHSPARAGPGRRGGGRVAADRREVPAGGLPAAAGGVRRGRRGRGGSCRAPARGARPRLRARHPRQVPRPAAHHRLRRSCSCRPRASTPRCCGGPGSPTRCSATCAWCRRPDDPVGDSQQPADGIPHARHRAAGRARCGRARRREDAVRQVRRPAARRAEEAAGGHQQDGRGDPAEPHHRAQAARRRRAARRRAGRPCWPATPWTRSTP